LNTLKEGNVEAIPQENGWTGVSRVDKSITDQGYYLLTAVRIFVSPDTVTVKALILKIDLCNSFVGWKIVQVHSACMHSTYCN
jgi:hypothetical protein